MAASAHASGDAVMRSAAAMQARLNALLPGIFPLHASLGAPGIPLPQPNMAHGRNLLRYHLRPRREDPFDDRTPTSPAHTLCRPASPIFWTSVQLTSGCWECLVPHACRMCAARGR
jgi:hypothetical protein